MCAVVLKAMPSCREAMGEIVNRTNTIKATEVRFLYDGNPLRFSISNLDTMHHWQEFII
jgi:hypothetical protein